VLALGALLTVAGATLPGAVFGALQAVSGLLVVGIGIGLLVRRVRAGRLAGHGHGQGHGHGHGHGHADGHGHAQADGHGHADSHGESQPDDPRPGEPRWRGLLALGLAGGLTPSPSALILLLGATAAGRPWVGVAAVVAFGAGMAVTLTAAGVAAALLGDRLLTRRPASAAARRVLELAPVLAAVAIVVAGAVLVAGGLVQATRV